jgi:hypothetical protein
MSIVCLERALGLFYPTICLTLLNRPRGLRRVVRLLLVGTAASITVHMDSTAKHFGPSFAAVVEQLLEKATTPPTAAHG